MGDNGQYQDDDEKRAALLDATINPIASSGGDPDDYTPSTGVDHGSPSSWQMPGTQAGYGQGAMRPQDPAPTADTPTAPQVAQDDEGKAKDWKYYAQQGAAGQLRSTQAAEATTQALANQPDEATANAPIEKQRVADAAATPDPSAQQYRPSIGSRILRGMKAVSGGIVQGGVLGGLAAGLNADYSAPNKQYGIDSAKNQRALASDDQQISEGQKAYQDATARAKATSSEQRAVATGYSDVTKGATGQETEENNAAREAETARHNKADEALKRTQETNTATYQSGELKNTNARVGVEASRLAFDKHKYDLDRAAGNTPGGDMSVRQPLIDKSAAALQAFKDGMTYQPDFGNYLSSTGKPMTQAEYIDKLNEFGANLDAQLVQKKQPPLGLRYKGGPNGKEIPIQTPQTQAPAAAPKKDDTPRKTQTTVHSNQQVSVGDTVMYKGQPKVVKGFNEKGQIQFQ